jgi:hypothetical protein
MEGITSGIISSRALFALQMQSVVTQALAMPSWLFDPTYHIRQ